MTSMPGDGRESVRLLFEMTREDNPRLYDDLIRFNKGTKRVNRLRFLAYEGLMAQHRAAAPSGSATTLTRSDAVPGASASAARHTNQAFDLPQVGET